jgi:hypothetical protein
VVPVSLSHTLPYGERVAFDDLMHKVEEIRHPEALQPLFGELNERLGPVTHHVQHTGSQGLQPLISQHFPRGVGPIVCHLFLHNVPSGHILEDQDHLFQEDFVHGPNNLSYLAMGDPVLLPTPGGLLNRDHQCRHHAAQGRGRTAHLRLKTETRKKLTDRVHAHAAFETEGIERGDYQPS